MILNFCIFVFLIFALVNIVKMIFIPAKTSCRRERTYYKYYIQNCGDTESRTKEETGKKQKYSLSLIKCKDEKPPKKAA